MRQGKKFYFFNYPAKKHLRCKMLDTCIILQRKPLILQISANYIKCRLTERVKSTPANFFNNKINLRIAFYEEQIHNIYFIDPADSFFAIQQIL